MNERARTLRAVLALVLVTVIWGSGFIATQYAIASRMDASLIMALRFLLGALCVGVFARRRIAASDWASAKHGCIAGLILFSAFYAQTLGQGRTNVSSVAFITASNVLMIPLIEWAIYRRRPGLRVLLLCALAMGGILLLTVDFTAGVVFSSGDWLVLLCALLFALQIVYVGRTCNEHDPLLITFWQLLSAGAAGTALFLLLRPEVTLAQLGGGILPVCYLAVFSTCVCYALQTWAQQIVPPAQVGVILCLEGFFGTLFSLLLGLEALRAPMVLGGALIMASVAAMSAKQT